MFLLKYVERQLSSCFSQKNRRNNGANESNISSLLDYCRVQPIGDIVSTPEGGGGQNNAECFLTECQNDKFSQYSIHSVEPWGGIISYSQ